MWKQLAVGISAPLRQLGTGSKTPDVLLGTSASQCDRTQKDLVSVFPFLHSLLWIHKYSYQCHCFQHRQPQLELRLVHIITGKPSASRF